MFISIRNHAYYSAHLKKSSNFVFLTSTWKITYLNDHKFEREVSGSVKINGRSLICVMNCCTST